MDDHAAMKVYRRKLEWIAPYARDRRVLDLGCVCHDLNQTAVPWLHGQLRGCAKKLVGLDCLDAQVARMNEQGYDARTGDAESFDLGEKFEVVVAGDILEHLADFRGFFESVRRHLAPGGLLLITTPNPITYVRFLRVLLKGSAGANKQHTCWFTPKVLQQLAGRCGYVMVDEAFIDDTRLFYPWLKPISGGFARRVGRRIGRLASMGLIWKPAVWFNSALCRLRPRLAETFGMAFRPADDVDS